ncbi:MAG: hypothetical protein HY335_02665 [Deinococcus sp.]|nr:hypothetical protein [Deinococcus sp.]
MVRKKNKFLPRELEAYHRHRAAGGAMSDSELEAAKRKLARVAQGLAMITPEHKHYSLLLNAYLELKRQVEYAEALRRSPP